MLVPGSLGIAALLAAIVCFNGLDLTPLRAPDEIRVAEIGREMLVSGDWVVPRLTGEPFIEHPPLYYFALSRSLALFGLSAPAARLPSALAGFATLLLIFDAARRIAGDRAGLLSLCVVASTAALFRYWHRCMVDAALTFFVTLGWWAYLRATELRAAPANDEPPARIEWWAILLLHVAGALTFLTKGVIGPALLAMPVAVDILVRRRWGFLRSGWHVIGAALLVGGCVVWPWLLYERGGKPLLEGFLIENVLYRVAPTSEQYEGGHAHPEPWFYLVNLPVMALPWIVALPAAAAMILGRRDAIGGDVRALRFVATVFAVGFVLLSAAGTKRALYLLPLLPPFGLAVGIWLARAGNPESNGRLHRWTLGTFAAVVVIVPALVTATLAAAARGAAALGVGALGRAAGWLDAWRARLVGFVRELWTGLDRAGSPAAPIAGAIFACFVAANFINLPAHYESRDPRPIAEALRNRGLLNDDLVGYVLDEPTRAVVPWYTGHFVRNVRSVEELLAFVRSHPRAKLLVDHGRVAELPPELMSAMELLESIEIGRRRTDLYASAPR